MKRKIVLENAKLKAMYIPYRKFRTEFLFFFINRKERERDNEGNQIKFAIVAFLLWSKSLRIAQFPA